MEVGSEVVRDGTGAAAGCTVAEQGALPLRLSAWLRHRDRSVLQAHGRAYLLVLGMCLLYVVARVLWLEADPPLYLPAGQPGRDIVVEPIAKATEARSYALFGRWTANPADNYQFWRLQAPAWVYPLAGWLKLCGVSLASLRLFSIAYTLLGFVAVLAIARLRLRGTAWWACGVFLAIDPLYGMYSRSAMLEPAVNTWLSAGVLCLMLARRHWGCAVLAPWLFALGFFTKSAAVYAFPVFLGTSAWLCWRVPGAQKPRLARALLLTSALVLGCLTATYLSSREYQRVLAWSVDHVLVDTKSSSGLRGLLSFERLWGVLSADRKWTNFATTLPITGPLALLELAALTVSLARRRAVDPWRLIVAGWFCCGVALLLFISRGALRYFMILPVPAALLAASALPRIARAAGTLVARFRSSLGPARTRAFAARAVIAGIGIGLFVTHSAWLLHHLYAERRYTIVEASRALEQHIGKRRVAIIGYAAAAPVFSTPYQHYYVRDRFNVSKRSLKRLRITHLLFSTGRDVARKSVRKHFPEAMRGLKPALTLPAFSTTLKLYELERPLGKSAKKRGSR